MTRITSKKYRVDARDLLYGTLIGAVTPVIVKVQEVASGGDLVFNWKQLVAIGIAGGGAYLLKKYLDPQQKIETIKKENKEG